MTRVSSCTFDDGCPVHAPDTSTPEALAELARRAAVAAAFEEVAREIRRNPAFPVPANPEIRVSLNTGDWDTDQAAIQAAADAMGVEAVPVGPADYPRQFWAYRDFGPISYHVAVVSPESMRLYTATQSYSGSVKPS